MVDPIRFGCELNHAESSGHYGVRPKGRDCLELPKDELKAARVRLRFEDIELLVTAFRAAPAPYPRTRASNIYDQVWHLVESLVDEEVEWLLALFVDENGSVFSVETLAIGDLDGVEAPPGKLARRAIGLRAAGIMLVHNHPSGDCRPSDGDFRFTARMHRLSEALDIPLLEHFVVARDGMRRIIWDHAASRYEEGRGFLPDPLIVVSDSARHQDDAYWDFPVLQRSVAAKTGSSSTDQPLVRISKAEATDGCFGPNDILVDDEILIGTERAIKAIGTLLLLMPRKAIEKVMSGAYDEIDRLGGDAACEPGELDSNEQILT